MQGITILNVDNSITTQSVFLQRFSATINTRPLLNFKRMARLWCSAAAFKKVSSAMQLPNLHQFTLLGSGDYHHLTLALLQQHTNPFTLVLFDNHPDWMRPPHEFHCGTWVYAAARLPQVARIIIVGLENGDLQGKNFQDGDVESYLSKKIILLPYTALQAEVDSKTPVNLQSQLKTSLKQGVQEVLSYIETEDVYVSVDKDCLRADDAITNWEQGTLPLETVTTCISAINQHHKIVGADTVGDYSPPVFNSPFKWIGSFLDRPANAWRLQKKAEANFINATANIKIALSLGLQ
jgi:arginase family enzyme